MEGITENLNGWREEIKWVSFLDALMERIAILSGESELGNVWATEREREREKMAMSAAMSQGVGAHNVFVYGSLLADEVVQVLLKRIPSSSPAVLPGYHRFSIKGRVYPAILPVENKNVVGRVLMGITNPELDILDIFEDVEYVRDSVEVSLEDNLEKRQTYAYVWDDKNDPDLYGEWDFEEWKEKHMIDFIKMTEEFVEELEQPESKSRVATYNSYYQSNDNPSAA